jgi:hypothetical protein
MLLENRTASHIHLRCVMSKYTPLKSFLARQMGQRVVLHFSEIERIIGAPLPRSAFIYQAWCAYEARPRTHVQKQAWQSAGFRTLPFDPRDIRAVTFERI